MWSSRTITFLKIKRKENKKQLLNKQTTINEKILFNFPTNSLQNMETKRAIDQTSKSNKF